MLIEEQEYDSLPKLSEKVAHLESIIYVYLHFMEMKEQAFTLKEDPLFAFKVSQSLPPLGINDAGNKNVSSQVKVSDVGGSMQGMKDKGKAKMYEEDVSNN